MRGTPGQEGWGTPSAVVTSSLCWRIKEIYWELALQCFSMFPFLSRSSTTYFPFIFSHLAVSVSLFSLSHTSQSSSFFALFLLHTHFFWSSLVPFSGFAFNSSHKLSDFSPIVEKNCSLPTFYCHPGVWTEMHLALKSLQIMQWAPGLHQVCK